MKTKIIAFLLFLAAWRVVADGIALQDFKLTGDLGGDVAAFTFTGNVKVDNANGGPLELLTGHVAITSLGDHPKWQMTANEIGRASCRERV